MSLSRAVIQGRTFDGRQHHCVGRHGTCKTKVAQLHVAPCSDQDILGLHVSVDDAARVRVQVVQGTDLKQTLSLLEASLLSILWRIFNVHPKPRPLPQLVPAG